MVIVPESKRARRKTGDILLIQLGSGRHAYAQVAKSPLVIFFDGTFDEEVPIENIPSLPVAFKLWVYRYAITKGIWPIIGSKPLLPAHAEEPFFFKQDTFTGRLSLYHSAFAATNYERPASLEECKHLECAAVWGPEHVVDRLNDHAAHRPNRWAENMRINTATVPA